MITWLFAQETDAYNAAVVAQETHQPATPVQEVVRARKFELVDSDNRTRIEIRMDESDPVMASMTKKET